MREYFSEEWHLSLPKSQLILHDNVLIKRGEKGAIVGRHEITDIRQVSLVTKYDWYGIFAFFLCLIFAIICKSYIPSVVWSWIATIVFMVLMLLGGGLPWET